VGRRSRKRAVTSPPPTPAAERPPARAARRGDERPPAPWGSFPLVELAVLVAIVIGVWGFLRGGRSGTIMLLTGCVLGSLAGLELSIREHFAGYRSHTTLLAGAAAVATVAALFFLGAPRLAYLPAGATVFGLGWWLLRGAFQRRSGGVSFR